MTTLTTTDALDGESATAAFINNNFASVESVVNGNLDNANIDAAANIAVSKLAAGSARTALLTIGGVPTWTAAPVVLDRDGSDISVSNTTTVTSVYTKTITGGDMGSDRMLRLSLSGYMTKNASSQLLTYLNWGGTQLFARGFTVTSNAVATNYRWQMEITIQNQGQATTQWVTYHFTGGLNDTVDSLDFHDLNCVAGSKDTASDQVLDVQFQWASADPNLTIARSSALLELL